MPDLSLFSLQNRDVWVFGGAGYLGQSTVRLLAAAGARILCVDLENRAEQFVQSANLGNSVSPATLDVRDGKTVERFVAEQMARRGVPHGLVNLTFASTAKTLEDLTEEDFDATNHGGLTATFLLTRAVGRAMAEQGRGSIVLFSSMYGSVSPDPAVYESPMTKNPIEYGVGKAGIIQMTRYLAVHWGQQQVRCNCISPGPFPNPNVQRQHPEFVERLARKSPLGRVGQADEIAGSVVFLLSDAASYLTGRTCLSMAAGRVGKPADHPKDLYLNRMEIKNYTQSAQWLERAKKVLAGGVSSEFRKYNYPHALFYTHGLGSRIYDVDGNEYLDFTLSQGPLILGHSHPHVLKAVEEYSALGQLFAGQHSREIELAEALNRLIPSAELMRFCLDGSEAVQTAFRVARAKTGRPKFLRFEGHYHGWLDNVCWGISTPSVEALGSRENPTAHPWTAGLPERVQEEFIILPWNDLDLVRQTLAERHDEIAALITEPIMCNNGCILPNDGFLAGLRALCDQYGIALIFDEVITGFRTSLGGAQQYFGITPDLSIFAKAFASGYPISAIVGKREWMDLIESAKVIHAGTMNSGNPTIAAALATLEVLETEQPYERIFRLGQQLMEGLRQAAAETGQNLRVEGLGPMFNTAFTDQHQVKEYRDTLAFDRAKLGKFIAGMQNEGVRVIGRGLWYISAAHTEADIDIAIQAARRVLGSL